MLMKEIDRGDRAYFHSLIKDITGEASTSSESIPSNVWRSFLFPLNTAQLCV